MSNPGLFDILSGFLDAFRIDLETDRLNAVLLGRGYHDSPVARTKVIDYVALFNLSQLEHPIDHFLRSRNIGDNLSFLSPRDTKVKDPYRNQQNRETWISNPNSFLHCRPL